MLANRVKETSSTTGTGDITLAGAVTAFQTFTSQFATSETFTYTIENDGTLWEIGAGHLSSGTVLVRDEVFQNSAGTTTEISFTGALTVFVSVTTFEGVDAPFATVDTRSKGSRLDGWIGASTFSALINFEGGLFTPGYFFTGRKVSSLGVYISFVDAGETATPTTKVGLYRPGDDGLPGKLIAQTGLLAGDTVGHLFGSITPVFLGPGPYWIAALTASTTVLYGGTTLNTTVAAWQSAEEFRPRSEQIVSSTAITTFADDPTLVASTSFNIFPDLRTRP